jgi:hypothetical protein
MQTCFKFPLAGKPFCHPGRTTDGIPNTGASPLTAAAISISFPRKHAAGAMTICCNAANLH